jgi:hypothetical protein
LFVASDRRDWAWIDECVNSFLPTSAEQDRDANYPSQRALAFPRQMTLTFTYGILSWKSVMQVMLHAKGAPGDIDGWNNCRTLPNAISWRLKTGSRGGEG